MAKITQGKILRQAKPEFIVRETPAWLDQRQDWISDGARKLYKTLRTLADAKSGRLFIPRRGWIRLSTVEKKAGMSHNTRKKFMRELVALGGIAIRRDYVTRSINGRFRKVLGQAQITVLPLHPQKPRKQSPSASTTDQPYDQSLHKHSVSTTDQSTANQGEKPLLPTNSCTVQELVDQVLSKNTNMGSRVDLPEGLRSKKISYQGSFEPRQTPPQNSERDWEKIPGFSLIELNPTEKNDLAQDAVLVTTWLEVVTKFESVGIQIDGFSLPNLFENTYQRLTKAGHKVSALFVEGKIRAKAKKARLVKAAESRRAFEMQMALNEQSRREERDQWHRQYELTIKLADERNRAWWAEQRAKHPPPSDAEVEKTMKIIERLRDGQDWRH